MKLLLIFINGWGFNERIFDKLIQHLEFDFDIHFVDPTVKSDSNSLKSILSTSQPKIILTWYRGLAYYLVETDKSNNILGLISISGSPCFKNNDTYSLGWNHKIVDKMISKLTTSPHDVMNDFVKNSVYDISGKSLENTITKALCFNYNTSVASLSKSLYELTSIDIISKVKDINYSVLLIHGKEDNIISYKNSLWLNKHIKNSKIEIISKCGHIPHMETPKETAKYINSFYKGVSYDK